MQNTLERYNGYALIGSFTDRERVAELESRFIEIREAKKNGGSIGAMLVALAEQKGKTFKAMEHKYHRWLKGGAMALADKRRIAAAARENIFYSEFKTYAERDTNTLKGGYDAMLRDIRRGQAFSFGTWRDLWKRDRPYDAVPDACPSNYIPYGFTYARMDALWKRDPTAALARAWHIRGQQYAAANIMSVLRSRVGLAVGAVFQADDVWHNTDVFMAGLKGCFNPLEFAIYDVASAFKVVSAMKPRMLVRDEATGKERRDNLKEQQFRFALAYLVCCKGFHRDGALFVLEHGTTAIREPVQRRIESIPGYGKLFKFSTSGIKNLPAVKGMFMGKAAGNPRHKSTVEGHHNIMHNATASLPGSHGRDAAHMRENNTAMVSYTEAMLERARKIDPTLEQLLILPKLDWRTYQRGFYQLEDAVMDRRDHKLEGWNDRERMYYRLGEAMDWRPCAELADLDPEKAAAIAAYLHAHPEDMQMMRMSRREAWQAGQAELIRLPLIEMPYFLDVRDVREATVREDGTIAFEDSIYFPGERKIYIAQVTKRDGTIERIAPGTKVKFFWNPLGELASKIWLADDAGDVVGMMSAMKTARWCDPESIKVAMGQQAHQIAELMADTRARHAGEAAAQLAAKDYNRRLLDAAAQAKKQERDALIGGDAEAVDFTKLAGAGVGATDADALERVPVVGDAANFLEEISRV